MKAIRIPIMEIMAATILVVPIGIFASQHQQAYAPRDCGQCVEFKKMTHEFEKTVITAVSVGNPDEIEGDLDAFVLFMRSPMFPPDPALDTLIANYEDGVMRIFSNPPPDDGKPHDQIKEFRQLTKAFEQGSINQLTAASIHPN
jgi:hypothetical protein